MCKMNIWMTILKILWLLNYQNIYVLVFFTKYFMHFKLKNRNPNDDNDWKMIIIKEI